MKTGLKNKIAVKDDKSIKSPWNFDAPEYDHRSSCYVNAGSHYGVGHRQPVGTSLHNMGGKVPVGKGMGMTVDEIPMKNLVIELKK